MRIVFYLTIYFTLQPMQILAEDTESVREVCRREVAGAYLTTYNQWIRNKEYTELLISQLTKLNAAKDLAQQAVTSAKQKVDLHEYDVPLQRAHTAAENRYNNITAQITEITSLSKKTATEESMAQKQLEKLNKELKLVFDVVMEKDKNSSFPYSVEFKSKCPKFRYACALPNSHAYELKDLSIAGEACQNYVNFSLNINRK